MPAIRIRESLLREGSCRGTPCAAVSGTGRNRSGRRAGGGMSSAFPGEPGSVLATAPPDPSYWPTAGWRTASPASQGIDGKRLDAMLAEIRRAKLPIDSVTVVRHGRVVLDSSFGRFASGTLGEPYASGRLHELQSATKSVTSMLLGIALQEKAATDITVKTPVLRLADSLPSYQVPKHTDARKRAMTIEDLLTMQSGLAWREAGYAYTPGSGNDLMTMFTTKSWTDYVIDRPMATQPGTRFVYNTGAAHLVSGVISILTGRPAAALAAKRLFAPLGIRQDKWQTAPEGDHRRRVRPATAAARPRQARLPLSSPRTLGRPPDRPRRLGRAVDDRPGRRPQVRVRLPLVARPRRRVRVHGRPVRATRRRRPREGPRRRDHGALPGDGRRETASRAGCSRRTSCRQPAERRPSSVSRDELVGAEPVGVVVHVRRQDQLVAPPSAPGGRAGRRAPSRASRRRATRSSRRRTHARPASTRTPRPPPVRGACDGRPRAEPQERRAARAVQPPRLLVRLRAHDGDADHRVRLVRASREGGKLRR